MEKELIQFALGCSGAAIVELQHWQRLARRGRWPAYSRHPAYWLITALVIAAGGFIAAAISGPPTSAGQLILLGMVGPQLLSQLAQSYAAAPEKLEPYLGPSTERLAEFIAG